MTSRDADGCEDVDGVAVVSGGDAAEVLEAAEHALDGVSVAVEHGRETVLPAPVGLGGMLGIVPFSSTCLRMALLS